MVKPARLLVSCPDRPGIVAAVSRFLFENGANVVHSDQHSTPDIPSQFFLRIEFEGAEAPELVEAFQPISDEFQMESQLIAAGPLKRLAVFVSKEDHCLQELLWQVRAGDIPAEIVKVIGNHRDLEPLSNMFGIPFHYIPVTAGSNAEAEAEQLMAVDSGIDSIVLARYMQIISPAFLSRWHGRVINIHHSFLPAFAGAKPYHQAYERGVKLIGATAHFVTEELDAGPIIEQDVQRVDHRADV